MSINDFNGILLAPHRGHETLLHDGLLGARPPVACLYPRRLGAPRIWRSVTYPMPDLPTNRALGLAWEGSLTTGTSWLPRTDEIPTLNTWIVRLLAVPECRVALVPRLAECLANFGTLILTHNGLEVPHV